MIFARVDVCTNNSKNQTTTTTKNNKQTSLSLICSDKIVLEGNLMADIRGLFIL